MYKARIADLDEMKQRLRNAWAKLGYVVTVATGSHLSGQWRR